jgi:hypothetical protein
MSDKKIVLVTWESCGHCHHMLNDVWNPAGGVKDQLTKMGWTINHETIPAGPDAKGSWARTHPELKKYVNWYPCIIKYNGSEPKVFASISRNGRISPDSNIDYTIENIIRWVKQ